MKLFYRGNSYEYNPDRATAGNTGRPGRQPQPSQAPYTLIYRGITLRVDPKAASVPVPMLPTTYDLIYRGTTYHVRRDAQGGVTAVTQPVGATQARTAVPSSLPKHYVRKVHRANLLDNLQHRLQAARARGDQKLIELLEAERQQILA